MSSYDKTCEWLFAQLPMYQRQGKAAYKADLVNTEKLDAYFKNPHKNFLSVHVGGTNGKGSVSHILASILQKAGYKVGLYTSPHLLDFRERIKVNGTMMPKKEVVSWVRDHQKIIEELKPSFFELTVAMAFDYFSRSGIDIAVIEVGMGGRLDSTNIIRPLLSVITNISMDHVEFLGDNPEKIAFEKAGIIKERVPVIIGEERKETFHVFTGIAKKRNSPLYSAGRFFQIPWSVTAGDAYQYFNVRQGKKVVYPGLKSDLLGVSLRKNLPVVLQAVEILRRNRLNISVESVYEGVEQAGENTGFRGRWDLLSTKPRIIADTAHNQAGIKEIFRQLEENRYETLHIVFGVVNDKQIDHLLRQLPGDARYYFTKADIPRAMDYKILGAKAAYYGLKGDLFPTVERAVSAAGKAAGEDDLILITGSTFIVADALKINLG